MNIYIFDISVLSDDLDDVAAQDWTNLDVKTRVLRIENFRLSDIGTYR